MGKYSNSKYSQSKKVKRIHISKSKKSGRPCNIQMETIFLNIIRDSKLQVINAQSQLQLQMAFFTNDQFKKHKFRRQQNPSSDLDQKSNLSVQLNSGLISLTNLQKKELSQVCQNQNQRWKFQELQSENDLPEYFFQSGKDLSYVLYKIILSKKEKLQSQRLGAQKVKIQNQQANQKFIQISRQKIILMNAKFKPEQLLFVCLFCLNQKQNLKFIVLDFFLKNQKLILSLISNCTQKVHLKYLTKIQQQMQKQRLIQLELEKKSLINQSRSLMHNNQNIKQDFYQEQLVLKQKESLKKPVPRSNKTPLTISGPKTSKYESFLKQQQDQSSVLNQKDKQQKLIFCLINYISWAFFYIYQEYDKLIKLEQGLGK